MSSLCHLSGWFWGLASAEGQILCFPIDFDGRHYNTDTAVWACDRPVCQRFHSAPIWYRWTGGIGLQKCTKVLQQSAHLLKTHTVNSVQN